MSDNVVIRTDGNCVNCFVATLTSLWFLLTSPHSMKHLNECRGHNFFPELLV